MAVREIDAMTLVVALLRATRECYRRSGAIAWSPMFAYNLDHVAIAVADLDAAVDAHKRQYGVEPLYRESVESQGVEEAMLPLGGSFVQLLQPLGPDTPVGRFIERHGEGLHHVAYAVADIEAALRHLEEDGVEIIDREPRVGGRGARIAFVHPRSFHGTLVELVEVAE